MDLILMNINENEIAGESTITDHDDEIEVNSFSHNVSLPMQYNPSTNGRTVGRSIHGDFTISKQVDVASPKLNLYCCRGTNIPTITVNCCRNDGDAVLPIIIYELTNVIVSSVSASGGSGGAPMETVTFNYTAFSWTVHAQKESNTEETKTEANWNLETNAVNA